MTALTPSIPEQLVRLAGPEQLAALGTMLATIPVEWVPALSYVSGAIGPTFDAIRGTFLVRIIDYAAAGYTLEDIQAACRSMSDPETQAACSWPNDYLQRFALAVVNSRKARAQVQARLDAIKKRDEDARERETLAAFWQSPEGVKLSAEMRARWDVGGPAFGTRRQNLPLTEEA